LEALGTLVFNFNSAESSLRRLAFLLIDPADARTGEITIDALQASWIESLVLALAPHRLAGNPEMCAKVVSAAKRFGAMRDQRNTYLHAIWVLPNDCDDPELMVAQRVQFRKGTRKEVSTIAPDLIKAAAREASAAGQDLMNLYEPVKEVLTSQHVTEIELIE
jgi:hypothetical protein